MWADDDLVMISALEHYSYCPRQCGLIHVEQVFDENVFTLRGRRAHERAHEAVSRMEDGVRVERGLPLWSDRLGLVGVADVVELRPDGTVYPVEYKHGARRQTRHDALQLCAQALCLEEMLRVPVPLGAIFSHGSRRRRELALTPELRAETEQAVRDVRAMLRRGALPPAVNDARCPSCSLIDACLPEALAAAARIAADRVWRLDPQECLDDA
ncbi:MAG: CRISPR-associated protein Cas4 [Armatimonadota bacterium]